MTIYRPIDGVTGRSPDVRIMLYLLEHGSAGIQMMLESDVASLSALNRSLRDLIINHAVERDTSGRIHGRPYKLTPLGKKVAEMFAQIESLLPQHKS